MSKKTGIWLVGARGSVSTCLTFGLEAIRREWIPPTGLVTELEMFRGIPLVSLNDLIVGGHETKDGSYSESGMELVESHILSHRLYRDCQGEIGEWDSRVRRGFESPSETGSKDPGEIVDEIRGDLQEFVARQGLSSLVVVNLASTEPYLAVPEAWETREGILGAIREGARIPASVLYAFAALEAGFPYVNFTPSIGNAPGGLMETAERNMVPHCGRDGKTGETLVKTVLAPLFAARNLKVMSWQGYNMLGNGDGRTLSHPSNRESKIRNKDEALRKILKDDSLHSKVAIDYVPSLGDWKTAWDFIHFQGFLNVSMSLQFTWQGSDSALAAPLVLDLVRLSEFAKRKGEFGLMRHAAPFFKSPLGVEEQSFHKQTDLLESYLRKHRES